jgi:DNA-binding HxlR family transcriptional regulator
MPVSSLDDLEHIRLVLDELTGKWSLLTLNVLCQGPARFNALKRANKGVSQKALTQCLRRLEACGLITRSVISTSPVAVVYTVSPLGASLEPHMKGILQWSADHRDEVFAAKAAFAQQKFSD